MKQKFTEKSKERIQELRKKKMILIRTNGVLEQQTKPCNWAMAEKLRALKESRGESTGKEAPLCRGVEWNKRWGQSHSVSFEEA